MSSPSDDKHQNLSDFLTVGEAAAFLGVSASTLRNWDRHGKLAALRHPVNGYRLYKREDLEQLLEALATRKQPPEKRGD